MAEKYIGVMISYKNSIIHCILGFADPGQTIKKTCLYNFDPLKPLLYNKTGVYRGIHYFSYFCSKTKIVGTH